MRTDFTVGSLFAGIGGFDLAAEWVGWRTRWFSEIEPFASQQLAALFPDAVNHGDITKIDFTRVEKIDVLCGGFPCQDISYAGKGEGLDGERSGLWKEYRRAIGDLRPRYVVVENVSALLVRGLDRVLGDLATLGYDAEWHCIPASSVGAPHRRDRIWIVGYPSGGGRDRDHRGEHGAVPEAGREGVAGVSAADRRGDERGLLAADGGVRGRAPRGRRGKDGTVADPQGQRRGKARGLRRDESAERAPGRGETLADPDRAGLAQGDEAVAGGSPEQPHRRGLRRTEADVPHPDRAGLEGSISDGRAHPEGWEVASLRGFAERGLERARRRNLGWWATEPDVGRVAYGVPARVDRLRCLGNAIVPQVVEVVFRAILAREYFLRRLARRRIA